MPCSSLCTLVCGDYQWSALTVLVHPWLQCILWADALVPASVKQHSWMELADDSPYALVLESPMEPADPSSYTLYPLGQGFLAELVCQCLCVRVHLTSMGLGKECISYGQSLIDMCPYTHDSVPCSPGKPWRKSPWAQELQTPLLSMYQERRYLLVVANIQGVSLAQIRVWFHTFSMRCFLR